jgi:hypothetical protein
MANIGHTFSARSISAYFKSEKCNVSDKQGEWEFPFLFFNGIAFIVYPEV